MEQEFNLRLTRHAAHTGQHTDARHTGAHILTWEWLRDDLVLHNNVRNLGFDLNCLPGQLGEDLLTEQNVLRRLQLHVPRLRT